MSEKLHLDDAELRSLLHLMCHDLRNPLAAIVTNLEFAKRLLSRMAVDPDLAESVEDSVTACDVLRRIVANFDLLIKGNEVGVTLHDLDVGATVAEVTKRCGDRARQAQLELEFGGNGRGPRTVLDRSLFSLAVENVIANSLQHAPRGSTVRVTVEPGEGHAQVVVRDDGPAIPEALRETALGPEGHTTSGRAEGMRYGRGLGLLAARAAAAACGCTLIAGGETTSVFTIEVPVLDTSSGLG